MRLKILSVPNPTLRKKSKAVKKFDSRLAKFVRNLEETLVKKKNPAGVGLSAPQVGKLWRVFSTYLPSEDVVDLNDLLSKKAKGLIVKSYLNPKIIKASKKMTLGPDKKKPILEGCLSIPRIYGPVRRHEWIKLRWQAIEAFSSDGGPLNRRDSSEVEAKVVEKTKRFSGFTARVIQHEIDHFNGILFTDLSLKQNLPLYEECNGKLEPIQLS